MSLMKFPVRWSLEVKELKGNSVWILGSLSLEKFAWWPVTYHIGSLNCTRGKNTGAWLGRSTSEGQHEIKYLALFSSWLLEPALCIPDRYICHLKWYLLYVLNFLENGPIVQWKLVEEGFSDTTLGFPFLSFFTYITQWNPLLHHSGSNLQAAVKLEADLTTSTFLYCLCVFLNH